VIATGAVTWDGAWSVQWSPAPNEPPWPLSPVAQNIGSKSRTVPAMAPLLSSTV
jgi:hypothetical protein